MKEPLWLTEIFFHAANAELVHEFGGLRGPCKENLLRSAIERPRNLFAYGSNPDLFDLAAAYSYGLAKNHPFSDGNKRVAFVSMNAFLLKNGWELVIPEVEAVAIMVALASSEIGEPEVAAWLKKNSVKIKTAKPKTST